MSSRFVNTKWFKLIERLRGTDPEENYIHYYYDQDEEYVELITNGGDVETMDMKTFKALQKRKLLKLIDSMRTIQPDTWNYNYTIQ